RCAIWPCRFDVRSCFLYYYRDHRHLHSFPTRRSSDLSGLELGHSKRRRLAAHDDRRERCRRELLQRVREPERVGRGHVDNRGGGDRKSTRLNSSHVSISYAVFCLKKKKINTRIRCIVI